MSLVNIRVKELRKIGYNNFEEWLEDNNHVYIGRKVYHLTSTFNSPWRNPYPAKKYGIDKSLQLYETYIKTKLENRVLDINELKNKTLGCWCTPDKCHGDILLRLMNE